MTDVTTDNPLNNFIINPSNNESIRTSPQIESVSENNETMKLLEFLESKQGEPLVGIFTLTYIVTMGKSKSNLGYMFPFVITLCGLLTILAQVVLPMSLYSSIANEPTQVCSLPGSDTGGSRSQRAVMFGVAALYTGRLTMRTLKHFAGAQFKYKTMNGSLDRHGKLNLLFNVDALWQSTYINALYLMNLPMIFFVRKENLYDMIFNAIATEYIIDMDHYFVSMYREYFELCPQTILLQNETKMNKCMVNISDFFEILGYLVSVIASIVSFVVIFLGPICKPK